MAGTNYFTTPARRPAGDPFLRARDERVESLKAVVGKLAHDFNNFLVPQFGYLTLLTDELPPEGSAAQYLKTMEGAGRTTEAYIESVLLAVRPQRQYAPKELDLAPLLNEALQAWTAALPPGVAIEVDSNVHAAPLQGDERHWRKLVEHLFSNARFGLAFGGRLHVSLSAVELWGDQIERLGVESSEVYCLRLEDSGIGMSEGTIARAFEPFFSTHPKARGSGLGLTIVHSVTHFHGGQVELQSAPGRGTIITLWIPRTPPATVRSGAASLVRGKPKKHKALLIEDDIVAEQVLRGWLAALDFDVQVADTPDSAVKLLTRDAKTLSLVISERLLKGALLNDEVAALVETNGLPCIHLAPGSTEKGGCVLEKPFSQPAFAETVLRIART